MLPRSEITSRMKTAVLNKGRAESWQVMWLPEWRELSARACAYITRYEMWAKSKWLEGIKETTDSSDWCIFKVTELFYRPNKEFVGKMHSDIEQILHLLKEFRQAAALFREVVRCLIRTHTHSEILRNTHTHTLFLNLLSHLTFVLIAVFL